MTIKMNLYKIKTTEIMATFFVVATDHTTAANMVEEQWRRWGYLGSGKAINVELIAENEQYTSIKNTWLLLQEKSHG